MKDISNTKIWIGNNPKLACELFTFLYDNGYNDRHISCTLNGNPSCIFIANIKTFGAYGQDYSKKDFDNNKMAGECNREITPYYLLNSQLIYEIF